ncbi:MAG: tetratricopeptide repeat-containing protein [uncultured bacterium]|nr:MAG: tetratricopeptide repeat-containing protein [uncultured bacterium]
MGRIFEHTGAIIDAVKAFMQCGEKQLKARDAEHAIAAFKEAIRLDPNNQTVRMRLAMIYDKMGLKAECVTEYLFVAALMQSSGDTSKASQVVQYTLGLEPNNQEVQHALMQLKTGQQMNLPQSSKSGSEPVQPIKTKQTDKLTLVEETLPKYDPLTEARLVAVKEMAAMLFEQPEAVSPDEQVPMRRQIHLLRGTGVLSSKDAEKSRARTHLSRTIDLQTAGKDDEAAVEMERAIDLGLNLSAAEYLLALLIHTSNPQKALKHLQKAVRNPAYALASNLLMAQIQEKAGQLKDSSNYALQALKLADVLSVPRELENELTQLYEPILEAHERVNEVKDLANITKTVQAQLMRNDWREYLKEARSQLPRQPEGSPPIPLAEMLLETTNSQVIEALALIKQLAAEGRLRTAMEEAFYALTHAPTYLPLHVQIGELLIMEGRIHEAVEKFNLVAYLYNVRGETNQAVRLLTRVAKLAPMDLSVRDMLIDLLISSGRMDEAVQQYMDIANVHYLLAELDLAREDYQKALSLSQKTVTSRTWAVQILNKLADIELQSLDLKQAIKILEQLRSLEPLDSTTRATLIDLYLRIGLPSGALNELDSFLKLLETAGHTDRSEHFLDALLEDRPDNIDIQKRLIRFFQNQNKQAEIIEKLDVLAEKCLRQENREGALATLQNLIALNPPNSNDYRRLYDELKNQKK